MRSNVSSDDQASCARAGSCLEVWRFNRSLVSCQFNDRIRCSQFEFSIAGLGTMPKAMCGSLQGGRTWQTFSCLSRTAHMGKVWARIAAMADLLSTHSGLMTFRLSTAVYLSPSAQADKLPIRLDFGRYDREFDSTNLWRSALGFPLGSAQERLSLFDR